MDSSIPDDARPSDIKGFCSTFLRAKGTIQALIISTLLSFAMGCTAGMVPEILSDRYARLNHQYDGLPCFKFTHHTAPQACLNGADDAQEASAWGALLMNMLTLFFNPVMGSISDLHGRRMVLTVSIFLCTLAPIVLVVLQIMPKLHPLWYYLASSIVGTISYIGVMFAALSDTIPEEFRASSFALIMAGFYSGYALAPSTALLMDHFQVSVVSAVLAFAAFVFTLACFPETLPESIAEVNQQHALEENEEETNSNYWYLLRQVLTRPFREAKILNQDVVIRLVAVGSFFSAMVYSTDVSLVVFYIENHLNVRDGDIARMFLLMGVLGIMFQAVFLPILVKILGEKGLLVTSFLSGTFHNFLYGVARDKRVIYVALAFSQLTKTNYPILSSLASKGASANEQGQVQGALFASNALASAIGPLSMQYIYDHTENTLGAGTMFLFASLLYLMGTVAVSFIPVENNSDITSSENDFFDSERNDIEEPLLLIQSSTQTDSNSK